MFNRENSAEHRSPQQSDNQDPARLSTKEQGKFLVVGIGASAGGIKPLKAFFECIPKDSGCAFVVILHLSPDFESHLAEILRAKASIPVEQVTHPVRITPNHGYVIAPGLSMQMVDGLLTVKPFLTYSDRRAPIDIFFRTLGESQHARSIAVVLSGTGSDGSMGVKRVKERGGIIIVQDPDEAEYREMPLAALETNLVDYTLPVREMPSHIIAYGQHLKLLLLPDEDKDDYHISREGEDEAALQEIYTQLRIKTGHDFTLYKRATVLRRIARRMSVCELKELKEYIVYLRANPDEAVALLKDLLISVTNFFRDKDAYAYLGQQVVPVLLKGKKNGDVIRIWITACATGEEAYSVAMIFKEQMTAMSDPPELLIFATDIDNDAIATAREGIYTNADVADVSPERLNRFFIKEAEDIYRVRQELREHLLFAHQDILRDPPFSRLSLVACRNLLIYLMRSAQDRVLRTIHFALEPGGFLMLGAGESANGMDDLFITVDREQGFYKSRPVVNRRMPRVADFPGQPGDGQGSLQPD